MELPEIIKIKLSEAVELWADENLTGKPALLANMMYFNLEKTMIEDAKKILKDFS